MGRGENIKTSWVIEVDLAVLLPSFQASRTVEDNSFTRLVGETIGGIWFKRIVTTN